MTYETVSGFLEGLVLPSNSFLNILTPVVLNSVKLNLEQNSLCLGEHVLVFEGTGESDGESGRFINCRR